MSRSNLQKEKFVSTRVAAGKRAGTSEKMKPSISNSFIKKQSAQIKTMSQGKGHNFTMGNNHDSKKVNEIRGKMESSVALPKIGKQFEFKAKSRKLENRKKDNIFQRREKSAMQKLSMEGLSYQK